MDSSSSEVTKKKEFSFALLRRRSVYFRLDIVSVCIVTSSLFWTFGWQLTDKEDLLAIGCLVLAILVNGVLLLCNFWSVSYHETIAYQALDNRQIDQCTHIRVRIDNKK